MDAKAESINAFLSSTRQYLQILQTNMPRIASFRNDSGATDDSLSFEILQSIPLQINEVASRPVISVAFCGPSGAGKSTVFNLLTGLKVPAGGAVRPTTHASLAAMPAEISKYVELDNLFHGFELASLTDPAELKNPGVTARKLFYTSYESANFTDNLWPCLIDIPDFNTTELTNWEKAEQMIRRADSIIFTVYHEAYKDMRTFEILNKVLQIAGNITWLLTKLDPLNAAASAAEIRADLINCAEKRPEFLTRRADGQTLIEFLSGCAFYYSPYSTNLSLAEIQPVENAQENFVSHIFSQKGLEVALRRQLQSIKTGVDSCESICVTAELERQKVQSEVQSCEQLLASAAKDITGEEFPVFRILELIRKQLEEHRPSFLRRALQPFLMLGSGIMKAITSVGSAMSGMSNQSFSGEIKRRDLLERKRLHHAANLLVELWRKQPYLAGFTSEQCSAATEAVCSAELPPVDLEWEKTVNESLQKWQTGNKDLWRWMNIIDELFMLFGFGLVVADFFLDGGVGTLGVVAVVGGSSAAGGLLMSLFNNLGLSREIVDAHSNWKKLRQASYVRHLREKLAGPLFFDKLQNKMTSLSPDLITSCENACRQLKEICRIHEIR